METRKAEGGMRKGYFFFAALLLALWVAGFYCALHIAPPQLARQRDLQPPSVEIDCGKPAPLPRRMIAKRGRME